MLHSNIRLTEQSTIHGKGLVTTDTIRAGEVVWKRDSDEKLISLAEIKSWPEAKQNEFFWLAYQVSEDAYIQPQGIDGYMNHSCDPNTWWADDVTLIARRDIPAGEEVTYDYASSDVSLDFRMECRCGAAACRGTVTSQDHLNPAWQQQYGEHLPSYVLKAIAEGQKN